MTLMFLYCSFIMQKWIGISHIICFITEEDIALNFLNSVWNIEMKMKGTCMCDVYDIKIFITAKNKSSGAFFLGGGVKN